MLGDNLEALWSRKIHNKSLPLLVSSLLLRDYDCGQIDVACIKNNRIICYEVKSSGRVSNRQLKRLLRSSEFLGLIFKKASYLKVVE